MLHCVPGDRSTGQNKEKQSAQLHGTYVFQSGKLLIIFSDYIAV